jgi:hypothetical protein
MLTFYVDQAINLLMELNHLVIGFYFLIRKFIGLWNQLLATIIALKYNLHPIFLPEKLKYFG